MKGMKFIMTVGFISLGCSKNLVDTEMTIELFKRNNYTIINDPKKAEIIVINTCGFIESAKEEAINTILEMAEYKKKKCKYLIVMGCLVQRYKEELQKSLPEVDLFIKYSDYTNLWNQVETLIGSKSENNYNCLDYLNRTITTGGNYAYLRIADGCDNFCTFCAIPYIRGKYISRKIEDILEEANMLVQNGYKELIIIAQDTTKYGIDIYGKPMLSELLSKISEIDDIKWVRFLYSYPETITDELIQTVKNNKKICNYFDIPIQHISDRILKTMNRKSTKESIYNLITKLRSEIPDVIIRTTVMVGFPGETNDDYDELYKFIKWAKFDRLGAFAYSKEDNTPAYRLPNHVHFMTKKSRLRKIMELQQIITAEKNKNLIGKELDIIIESKTFDSNYYIGRSYMDVPDIDGYIYVKSTKNLLENQFLKCKIVDVSGYDLIGELI